MFGAGQASRGEQITELDLNLIQPHPQDPFKPYPEERLKELAESIAKVGLLDPINVRPRGDGNHGPPLQVVVSKTCPYKGLWDTCNA